MFWAAVPREVDTGAVALYVWGVSGDTLVRDGAVDRIHKAVEMAKASGLPVGLFNRRSSSIRRPFARHGGWQVSRPPNSSWRSE